jgi:hypothetical protein
MFVSIYSLCVKKMQKITQFAFCLILISVFQCSVLLPVLAQTSGPVLVTNSNNSLPISTVPINTSNFGNNNGINNGYISGSGQCGTVFNAGLSGNLGSTPQLLTNQLSESGTVINSESRIGTSNTTSIGAQLGFQFFTQKCADPKEQLENQEKISNKNNETTKYQTCIQSRTTLELAGKNPDVACLRP